MIWILMPRASADKSAEIIGWEVRFGVWMNIVRLAQAIIWRRNKFSGVGGGIDLRRISPGLAWCGDGSKMVEIWRSKENLVSRIDVLAGNGDSWNGFAIELCSDLGRAAPPLDQNAFQNSNNFSAISPLISIQPSNQLSQLTLQDGMKTVLRSTKMNFGCITLKGLTKTLFTTKSRPLISSGRGSPSPVHDVTGYILPFKLLVWNNFWKGEKEEKHNLTCNLRFWASALDESSCNKEQMASWEGDFAQKHVTMMTSCSAAAQNGRTDERIWKPVPILNETGIEVDISFVGSGSMDQ